MFCHICRIQPALVAMNVVNLSCFEVSQMAAKNPEKKSSTHLSCYPATVQQVTNKATATSPSHEYVAVTLPE